MEKSTNHRSPVRTGALLFLAACSKSEPAPVDAAPPPSVSLLQTTPARVAIEWQFESGGDPYKGWKGKWLAVRIPRDAHVASIALHVREPASASISRDGTKLKDASLTGDSVIPIDGPGGDYRVEITGEPRTISKLDVLGQPGVSRKPMGGLPTVRYGSLDIGEQLNGPWPTLMAYCEKLGGDRCSDTLDVGRDRDGDWFAMRTKRGWFVHHGAKNVETRSVRTERPEAGAPFESFVHVEREEMGTHVIATRELVICRVMDEYPECEERHVLGRWDGDVGLGQVEPRTKRDAGSTPFPPPSGKWNDPKAPRFLPDGGVIVE